MRTIGVMRAALGVGGDAHSRSLGEGTGGMPYGALIESLSASETHPAYMRRTDRGAGRDIPDAFGVSLTVVVPRTR